MIAPGRARVAGVADQPGEGGEKEAPKPQIDETWLEAKVKAIVDKLLGDEDAKDGKSDAPATDVRSEPRTDREREDTLRERVRAAVAELEEKRAHEKEHEELKSKVAQPPQQETKPWRHRIWD